MSNSVDEYVSDSNECLLAMLRSAPHRAPRAPQQSVTLQNNASRVSDSVADCGDSDSDERFLKTLARARSFSACELLELRRLHNRMRSRRYRARVYADPVQHVEALTKRRASASAKRRRNGSPCAAARHRAPVHAARERRAAARGQALGGRERAVLLGF